MFLHCYMKFFADTADPGELEYCFSRDVDDGITTNPKIMQNAGITDFEEACKRILGKYKNVHVSLETDLRGIPIKEIKGRVKDVERTLLQQAELLSKLGENVVIKIPICEGGLNATRVLSKRGIKTNVTACMTPYQALEAASAGATYVSLFANRMLDAHIIELSGHSLEVIVDGNDWKKIVAESKEMYLEQAWERTLSQIAYVAEMLDHSESSLIVGSIRSPKDIYQLAACRPQVITIPKGIVDGLSDIPLLKNTPRSFKTSEIFIGDSLYHPITDFTLDEFEKAADTYRNN